MTVAGAFRVALLEVNGELTAPREGTSLTIVIDDDRVSGSSGVNRYFGTLEGSGFGPLANTLMAGPEDQMVQEAVFLELLAGVDAVHSTDSGLELWSNGRLVVAADVITQGLEGTSWLLTFFDLKDGFRSVVLDSEVTAVFGENGDLTGSSGCNRYVASFRVDNESISVSATAGTRMMCPDPEIMEQETRYLELIMRAATYELGEVDGERTLDVFDDEGLRLLGFVAL